MADKVKVTVLNKKPVFFAGAESGLEKYFKLEHWRVKCGDREDDRLIWKRGKFVFVVALTKEKKLVLLREYKQAVEQTLLGLPAGGIKKDETPIQAALRELQEESGYIGKEENCKVHGPFFNSPDKSTEEHYVVFVPDVEFVGANPEESETILGVELSFVLLARKEIKIGMHLLALNLVFG